MSPTLTRVVDATDTFFRRLGMSVGIVVVAMVLMISYGVLAREVFKFSDVWVTEGTTYLMGYMTFVGAAALAWQGRHLKVDVLQHYIGPRARLVLDGMTGLVIAVVALALCALAAAFWWDAWITHERSWGMLSLPLWIPYLSLLVGSVLLALAQLARLALLFTTTEPPLPGDMSLTDGTL